MARNSISIATLYSSAQCVLSVVGSVGVILLFAGIPQLIYSPAVSAANLLTFVTGAVLIMTMVAGNTFLNYKFRSIDREGNRQGTDQGGNGDGSSTRAGDPEDKPPSYDAILTLDGPPPEYASIMLQKPPKYEEIVKTYAASVPIDDVSSPTTRATLAQPHAARSPATLNQKKILTLDRVEEEVTEEGRSSENEQTNKHQAAAGSAKTEEEEQGSGEPANRSLSSRDRHCVASETSNSAGSQFLSESET